MSAPAIEISGVSKTYGTHRAVRDLDLVVPAGSICGFLGPNGAGKSTTIRMIMSIIRPDSGTIRVLGGDALERKDRIGYLPEERGIYRKMRVGEFLEYIGRLKGMPRTRIRAHVDEWLERIELPGVRRKRCEELSKGMQQKVQVLASIIHDPDLVILDEPFSGLDPVNAEVVSRLVHELHDAGRTIIFSTHLLDQAEEMCDRIFLINRGVKLLDATIQDIAERFDPRTVELELSEGAALPDDIPGVLDVQPLSDRTLELHLASGADRREVFRDIITRTGVDRIQMRKLSLREVFVRLVREDIGAEAAAAVDRELAHG